MAVESRRTLNGRDMPDRTKRLLVLVDNYDEVATPFPLPDTTLRAAGAGVTVLRLLSHQLHEPEDVSVRIVADEDEQVSIDDVGNALKVSAVADRVTSSMLAGLTRVIRPYGSIASCGLAASADLATTVMPFIIRGVSLLGVASAGTARPIREQVWEHLADDWKPAHLERIADREVALADVPAVFPTMLAGGSLGRTVVRIG